MRSEKEIRELVNELDRLSSTIGSAISDRDNDYACDIVDALQWVLGETTTEDFLGTEYLNIERLRRLGETFKEGNTASYLDYVRTLAAQKGLRILEFRSIAFGTDDASGVSPGCIEFSLLHDIDVEAFFTFVADCGGKFVFMDTLSYSTDDLEAALIDPALISRDEYGSVYPRIKKAITEHNDKIKAITPGEPCFIRLVACIEGITYSVIVVDKQLSAPEVALSRICDQFSEELRNMEFRKSREWIRTLEEKVLQDPTERATFSLCRAKAARLAFIEERLQESGIDKRLFTRSQLQSHIDLIWAKFQDKKSDE